MKEFYYYRKLIADYKDRDENSNLYKLLQYSYATFTHTGKAHRLFKNLEQVDMVIHIPVDCMRYFPYIEEERQRMIDYISVTYAAICRDAKYRITPGVIAIESYGFDPMEKIPRQNDPLMEAHHLLNSLKKLEFLYPQIEKDMVEEIAEILIYHNYLIKVDINPTDLWILHLIHKKRIKQAKEENRLL